MIIEKLINHKLEQPTDFFSEDWNWKSMKKYVSTVPAAFNRQNTDDKALFDLNI